MTMALPPLSNRERDEPHGKPSYYWTRYGTLTGKIVLYEAIYMPTKSLKDIEVVGKNIGDPGDALRVLREHSEKMSKNNGTRACRTRYKVKR